MITNHRRLAISAAAACLLVALPAAAMAMVVVPDWLDRVVVPLMIFVIPGVMVALTISGNVHADNRAVSVVVSFLFWTFVIYALLSAYAHLRARRHAEGRVPHS